MTPDERSSIDAARVAAADEAREHLGKLIQRHIRELCARRGIDPNMPTPMSEYIHLATTGLARAVIDYVRGEVGPSDNQTLHQQPPTHARCPHCHAMAPVHPADLRLLDHTYVVLVDARTPAGDVKRYLRVDCPLSLTARVIP